MVSLNPNLVMIDHNLGKLKKEEIVDCLVTRKSWHQAIVAIKIEEESVGTRMYMSDHKPCFALVSTQSGSLGTPILDSFFHRTPGDDSTEYRNLISSLEEATDMERCTSLEEATDMDSERCTTLLRLEGEDLQN